MASLCAVSLDDPSVASTPFLGGFLGETLAALFAASAALQGQEEVTAKLHALSAALQELTGQLLAAKGAFYADKIDRSGPFKSLFRRLGRVRRALELIAYVPVMYPGVTPRLRSTPRPTGATETTTAAAGADPAELLAEASQVVEELRASPLANSLLELLRSADICRGSELSPNENLEFFRCLTQDYSGAQFSLISDMGASMGLMNQGQARWERAANFSRVLFPRAGKVATGVTFYFSNSRENDVFYRVKEDSQHRNMFSHREYAGAFCMAGALQQAVIGVPREVLRHHVLVLLGEAPSDAANVLPVLAAASLLRVVTLSVYQVGHDVRASEFIRGLVGQRPDIVDMLIDL